MWREQERGEKEMLDAPLLWPRLARTAVILPLTDRSAKTSSVALAIATHVLVPIERGYSLLSIIVSV